MNHGLSERDIATLRRILSVYAEQITHVDLFGSRATGTYRPNSDIDLVLHGDVAQSHIDHLWTLFHESNLPMSVDVTSYDLTTTLALKEHIDNVSTQLLTREDLSGLRV
jgi:uncharacterized protein